MDLENIGSKIKKYRQKRNMTQEELASAMHISNKLISKWERGLSIPALDYLEPLCKVLNISMKDLVGETPKSIKFRISRNTLKTIIFSSVTFVLVTTIILLMNFVIMPAICQDRYLYLINQSMENSLLKDNYYNIEFDLGPDNIKLQGYLEDGKVYAYNTLDFYYYKQLIANDTSIKYSPGHGYCKKKYVKPTTINNLSDLLDQQLKSFSEYYNDDYDLNLNIDDARSYIRKTNYGYYFEIKKDYITKDLTETAKENIIFRKAISGKVIIEQSCFRSMTIEIKIKNKDDNKHTDMTTSVKFLQEKPEINENLISYDYWGIETNDQDVDAFVDYLIEEPKQIKNPDKQLMDKMMNEELFLTQDNKIAMLKSEGIDFFKMSDLSCLESINFEKETVIDGRTYKNGYSYMLNGLILDVKNEATGETKQFTLTRHYDSSYNSNNIHVYDNKIYLYNEKNYYNKTYIDVIDFESGNLINLEVDGVIKFINGGYAFFEDIRTYYLRELDRMDSPYYMGIEYDVGYINDVNFYYLDSNGVLYFSMNGEDLYKSIIDNYILVEDFIAEGDFELLGAYNGKTYFLQNNIKIFICDGVSAMTMNQLKESSVCRYYSAPNIEINNNYIYTNIYGDSFGIFGDKKLKKVDVGQCTYIISFQENVSDLPPKALIVQDANVTRFEEFLYYVFTPLDGGEPIRYWLECPI